GLAAGPTPTARPPKKSGAAIWVVVGALAVLVVGVGAAIAVLLGNPKPKETGTVAAAPTSKSAATLPTAVIPAPPPEPKDDVAVSDPRENLPVLDDLAAEKPLEPRAFQRHTGLVQAVALAPNGRRFLSASTDMLFLDWKIDDGKSFQRHRFK